MYKILGIKPDEAFFILEIANNHWGDVKRGLKLIRDHGEMVKRNGVRAAAKLQFHDRDTFIHKDARPGDVSTEVTNAPGSQSRYAKKLTATKMSKEDYKTLFDEAKKLGMVTMSTPYDEPSVDLCKELGVELMKVASSDLTSWGIVTKLVEAGLPTIISTGGAELEDVDAVVALFKEKGVPLAVQHCVSKYPSEDSDLEINQIDFLRTHYPDHVIGFSSHEYHDWSASIHMAYAKGARTFERHVDIDYNNVPVSEYCSLPEQMDEWYKAYLKAREMCGGSSETFLGCSEQEKDYIKSVVRGLYAKRDLKKGEKLTLDSLDKDCYFSIPLEDGQVSSREFRSDIVLSEDVKADEPIKK